MDNFLQTMPIYKLTEETMNQLTEFGEKNLEHVKRTVETYRNLIDHITYYWFYLRKELNQNVNESEW